MDLREKIDSKGIKHRWLADQIGVSKAALSLFLSGERSLSEDKEAKLRELIS